MTSDLSARLSFRARRRLDPSREVQATTEAPRRRSAGSLRPPLGSGSRPPPLPRLNPSMRTSLRRTLAAACASAACLATPAAAQDDATLLSGTWQGTYVCQQGQTAV